MTVNLRTTLARVIDTTHQDVRFALRQMARRPGFSFLVALTLAIGIGGSTAIFSVLKGVVLRELPYPEPDRLVAVWEMQNDSRSYQPFTGPDYLDVREQSTRLREFGVLTNRWFNLVADGAPVRLPGAKCPTSLLQALGVQPLHGRLFTEEEDLEGNDRVVILSHRLWQGHFGGDSDVVGRTVPVNGVPHQVVGIMPADFEFPTPWGGRDTSQLWAPLALSRDDSSRSWHNYGGVGRLADGATLAEVEAELGTIAAQLAAAYPDTNGHTGMWAEPLMKRTLGRVRSTMTFLLAVVGLVLLIACANIASMLIARGAQRTPEIAIRSSVGADRGRLMRQLLTRIRSLPGVADAGLTNKLPLRGGSNGSVLVNDQVFDPSMRAGNLIEHSFIDDGYHRAMGIPLLTGRTLTSFDLETSSAAAGQEISPVELPVVINRAMAEELWPDAQPIGQLVRPHSAVESYRARVIGVVEDVMQWGAERPPLPEMYFPYTSEVWGPQWAHLVVRTEGDPRSLSTLVRKTVRDIDPQIPVAEPTTMADVVRQSTGRRRFAMLLMVLFAATALALIIAGTYGVMSYSVSQRTHEIGVRMALGADRTLVLRHFLARAVRLFGPGLLLGLAGSLAASTLTRSMVFGVSPLNPIYVTAAVGAMLIVTTAAITIPVVRATRVNPVEALKTE